ncbi:DMT family transporter [Sphingobacterium sp. DR205]|uniref:DMT family transporter n=1 Tax=Sphingobacterium sp. DR205 TaxID=2713573 RepID=UPI0013E4E380|nr:DMT family transporter [Sphingobacterium sp. DR205]QIH34965.1 DMT family transporter [Sphingobacterium sp. DR205]
MKDYKSILYVAAGACSYGLLATLVKYANKLGIHTGVLTFLQFLIGFLFLLGFNYFSKSKIQEQASLPVKLKLTAWGMSLGLTSTLYYLAIQYIPVSVGIILLMQSIWISLIVEALIKKQMPSKAKIIGVVTVLLGTALSTDIFSETKALDTRGLLLGFGAGISYAVAIFSSSNIANQLPSPVRSLFLVLGGLLLIIIFWNIQIVQQMTLKALPWGLIIALFGTVLPPLFFTRGIPRTGIALGNIISSLEIPISTISAVLLLHETVSGIQWAGIVLILLAVTVINLRK